VPVEVAGSVPGAREQWFIAPPPDPSDSARAEQYARSAGYAFLPTIACTPELLSASGGPIAVTAFISSPASGQVMSGPFEVVGTVQFDPSQAQYYRVDIRGGAFAEWATINDIHRENNIVNGRLEGPLNLPPGQYQLQLIVVGNDGNFVQPPYQVSFTVQ
jgi:hypothetical protein